MKKAAVCCNNKLAKNSRQRLKVSWIYDAYWTVNDRRIIDGRRRQVEFYHGVLSGFRQRDLIFDIGANCGQKTDVFLRLGARVVTVDPDETNQEILKVLMCKSSGRSVGHTQIPDDEVALTDKAPGISRLVGGGI
jgi:hypothetical protein